MSRIIPAFTQFFDDNGDPLINGKLKFLESGTNNTDKDTFADTDETIPNSNPVLLDGAGRCPNVFGSGVYNVISYSSTDVQFQQFDPVSGDILEGAFSVWSAATTYSAGDIVTASDGNYYRSLINTNQNQEPSASAGSWEQVTLNQIWNTNVIYGIGDPVYGSDGVLYLSTTAGNTGNNPTTDTDNWKNSTIPVWITGATYSIGNLVFGSNNIVYSSNISLNTANNPILDSTNWTAITVDRIQSVSASVAVNALTVGLNPTILDFRSGTLTDGTQVTQLAATALSLVIPSGATLGTVNAVQSRLILLAIDNAGTMELAIVNLAGGNDLSETGVISTIAIDDTADSDDVIYSTTARTDVAYRVVGFVESTQATAGTWATAPSLIQGAGGNALTSMSSFGYGQKWQSPARSLGVTYYTGYKPIDVMMRNGLTVTITVGGLAIGSTISVNSVFPVTFTVPSFTSYVISGTASGLNWKEML